MRMENVTFIAKGMLLPVMFMGLSFAIAYLSSSKQESQVGTPEYYSREHSIQEAVSEAKELDWSTHQVKWEVIEKYMAGDVLHLLVGVFHGKRRRMGLRVYQHNTFFKEFSKLEVGQDIAFWYIGNGEPSQIPTASDFLAPDGPEFQKWMKEHWGGGY